MQITRICKSLIIIILKNMIIFLKKHVHVFHKSRTCFSENTYTFLPVIRQKTRTNIEIDNNPPYMMRISLISIV